MNIKELHTVEKDISAVSAFRSENSTATALQILEGCQLKEHITKVPAMLICIEGKAIFENEKGDKFTLLAGDYVNIEPMVKHWVDGVETSQLLLIR